MSRRQYLNKSRLRVLRECPRKLYIEMFRDDLRKGPSAEVQWRMLQGQEVGSKFHQKFPDGVNAWHGGSNEGAAEDTRKLLSSGASTLFEATFISDELLARVDGLRKTDRGWQMLEVKSRAPKEAVRWDATLRTDLAFQIQVLRDAGLGEVEPHLVTLNGQYVYPGGEVNIGELFIEHDAAPELRKAPDIQEKRREFNQLVEEGVIPEPRLIPACKNCEYIRDCHGEFPLDHVLYLPLVKKDQLSTWVESGRTSIAELASEELSESQKPIFQTFSEGRGFIADDLDQLVNQVQFPALFVDFETANFAIPRYPNSRPNSHIPFQFAALRVESPTSTPQAFEYLCTADQDPRHPFIERLVEAADSCRSIVSYGPHENTVVNELFDLRLPRSEQLKDLFDRGWIDMITIVKAIYRPGFRGSYSIKSVWPALVPGAGYGHLDVQSGESAPVTWLEIMNRGTHDTIREKLIQGLREYCATDVRAMWEVYEQLRSISTR